METSSPLAAMRPPRLFGQGDIFGSNSHFSRDHFGAGAMSLRDQFNFQRSNPDYFNVKSVRGSSPTASLAADLSQNFQINDSSPHFPTPRRALFTTTTLLDSMQRDYVTTPPALMPSSPSIDMMDVSPLPHKALFVTQIQIQSPTPVQSPDEDMMVDSPLGRQSLLEPPKPVVADRRKAGLRRPSLTRTKGYSTSAVTSRLPMVSDNQLPPFRFGGENRFVGQASSPMSPSECFQESPLQERRPQTANSPCPVPAPPRPRPQFGSLSNSSASRNGSPITGHARRPSNPFMRPRKQFRRSLSMFESPVDMIKPKKDPPPPPPTSLQAVTDVETSHEPVLPHFFPEGQTDSIPRITRSTMLDVLDGKYVDHFDQKIIIDCRFEYEYDGGHIDEAINYNDKDLLAAHLFQTPMEGRCLLIFHCEYSAHRAPLMARHIRAEDRNANIDRYPHLTYPEIYILEGGYSGFFMDHRDRCYPQAYVEMDDADHVNTCEREMNRLRHNRKGLGRAQTYAFGQLDHAVVESPTAPGRANVRDYGSPDMMIGASPILGNDRGHTRRMVSF